MILCLQICDSQGFPFYTRSFAGFVEINAVLLSGMVSAVGSLGRKLFKQDIATITFGSGEDLTYMVVIAKDLFFAEKSIYFVFYIKGEFKIKSIREIATTFYIENKAQLNTSNFDTKKIEEKVNQLIEIQFKNFQAL